MSLTFNKCGIKLGIIRFGKTVIRRWLQWGIISSILIIKNKPSLQIVGFRVKIKLYFQYWPHNDGTCFSTNLKIVEYGSSIATLTNEMIYILLIRSEYNSFIALYTLFLHLFLYYHSRRVHPGENSYNNSLWKLPHYDRRINMRSFLVSHLSMLIISPFHHIPYVQLYYVMSISTTNISYKHFLLFAFFLQDKVRKTFNFCYISYVLYLSLAKFSF